MADSWVTINSHRARAEEETYKNKKNQVKFMFGDEDSDSARSYQNSPQNKNKVKNMAKSPSVSIRMFPDNNGLDILNQNKSLSPSPSTRVTKTSATGSPILTNIDKKELEINNTKLPITSQFLLSNKVTANQLSTHSQSKINHNELIPEVQQSGSGTNSAHLTSVPRTIPSTISRTQAKLLLQRQHSYNEDESSLAHPQNQIKLTKELDKINREFGWLRKYHNPIQESLVRVMERKRMQLSSQK